MQINPGGRLQPEEVIGRSGEIARYWDILDRQGLVVSAERRIGKTHILLKMREECPPAYLPVYQDMEAIHSVGDLVRSIYAVTESTSFKARVAKWSGLLPSKIGGMQLPSTDTAWKTLLPDAFDHLIKCSGDKHVLMLWDEFPLMLHNLQQHESAQTTIQLLDYLRTLRLGKSDKLRFLFTGSIGLHLVLRSLRKVGSANAPINDMMSVTVPPMADADTCLLATELLKETRASQADIPSLAAQIASMVGGFPYYVHHVVDQLDQLKRPIVFSDISSAVDKLVYDPHDPANFNYYVTRLDTYYMHDDRVRALLVLDALAGQRSHSSFPTLLNLCRHQDSFLPDEDLRNILTMLSEDHYIESKKKADRTVYGFRWQLVKKWWRGKRL